MIQRWKVIAGQLDGEGNVLVHVSPDKDGDFVLYSDHLAEIAEYGCICAELGAAIYGGQEKIAKKDEEIAALNGMIEMKQDDWLGVCKENDVLQNRIKELEDKIAEFIYVESHGENSPSKP